MMQKWASVLCLSESSTMQVIIFWKDSLCICVCTCVLVYRHKCEDTHRGKTCGYCTRSPELKLQVVVNGPIFMMGTEPWSPAGTVSALSYWAFSTAPQFLMFSLKLTWNLWLYNHFCNCPKCSCEEGRFVAQDLVGTKRETPIHIFSWIFITNWPHYSLVQMSTNTQVYLVHLKFKGHKG